MVYIDVGYLIFHQVAFYFAINLAYANLKYNISQVIIEDDEDFCDTYYVPEGMSFSYTVVNGDLSFEME